MGIFDSNSKKSTTTNQKETIQNEIGGGIILNISDIKNGYQGYKSGGIEANGGHGAVAGNGGGGDGEGVGNSEFNVNILDGGAIDQAFGFAADANRDSLTFAAHSLDFSKEAIKNQNSTFEKAVSVLDSATKTVLPDNDSIEKILIAIVLVTVIGGAVYAYKK